MTKYPFPMPATLLQHLRAPYRDGNHYLDARVKGKWDGVLVVDCNGSCIGVYVYNRIEDFPLPFNASDIEELRPACLWNRILASIPFDPFGCAVLTIVAFSPIALLASFFVWPLCALFSIISCIIAIYVMYLAPGFLFVRLPVAILGLSQIISGCNLLIRSLG